MNDDYIYNLIETLTPYSQYISVDHGDGVLLDGTWERKDIPQLIKLLNAILDKTEARNESKRNYKDT
jgi:hypothetical protein